MELPREFDAWKTVTLLEGCPNFGSSYLLTKCLDFCHLNDIRSREAAGFMKKWLK